jgi:hypothetical protein
MKNKKCVVVANIVAASDFKRLENWLTKGASLNLSTRQGNKLVITNDGK